MKLFFPDCLWNKNQITGSSFLYFHDEAIHFSLHPSVSSFSTGVDPFSFIPFLEEKAPPWKSSFFSFLNQWDTFRKSLQATYELLEPLQDHSFKTTWVVYPRGTQAWKQAGDLLQAITLEKHEITPLIDSFHACDEFFSHLFFEKVLEARYGDMPTEATFDYGKRQVQNGGDPEQLIEDFNWTSIYDYCDSLFNEQKLPELLTQAYMFRMLFTQNMPTVLLSNPKLIKLFNSLPTATLDSQPPEPAVTNDVVAWECFRQLVSPIVDPLDATKVALIKEMIVHRPEEIERLKNRCYELTFDLSGLDNPAAISLRVKDVIRARISNELQDLLKLDKKAFNSYLSQILSDEKTWIAVSSFILALIAGGEVISAGAAIYGLSRLGAQAFKEAASRRKILSNSVYTLIYRMRQL